MVFHISFHVAVTQASTATVLGDGEMVHGGLGAGVVLTTGHAGGRGQHVYDHLQGKVDVYLPQLWGVCEFNKQCF